jgi:hypothetical protein
MTLNDHVSHIQSVLNKGLASASKNVQDEQIYHLLKVYRARLIWDKQNKFNKLSPFNYQTIHCLPLELVELNECKCYETGCVTLKSKCELPQILSYKHNLLIKVTLIDGTSVTQTSIKQMNNNFRKTKLTKFGWFIHDNKLVITGDKRLKVVSVTAVFEDPTALEDFCECTIDGEETDITCYDVLEQDFPMDTEMVSGLYRLVLEDFGMLYKYPDDVENNAKSTEISQDKE